MKLLRRALVSGAVAVATAGLAAPVATAATPAPPSAGVVRDGVSVTRTWHATVQCQIVRIRDNNVVGYDRADGSGNTKEKAKKAAERNIDVPSGHYKRHCDVKRYW
ncbi:hypothetical protein QIS99_21090 [Streptomyces sp. B-S-A8]|uniref:Uncharacterized protein n=1 Tax=Streptomyces solicavernae TaxID=3043614 RepID=A0ABT6RW56_9ACTN|nr:hypothetical protein [Streptomyces sp. B-S-A8]MDI3388681.1 hypothetical protein [Streptomyces sp. B-S-A8]